MLELLHQCLTELQVTLLEILLRLCGDTYDGVCLARNSVAQVTAVEVGKDNLEGVDSVVEEASKELVRVSATLVDVVARVATQQVAYLKAYEGVALGSLLGLILHSSNGIDTTCAADEELALILRVEVDEVLTSEHALAKAKGTCETCLLVHGEQRLDCGVLQSLVEQYCQRRSHTDTAVSAKRCALGIYPAILDEGADGVVLEVKLHIRALLAYHIHV